MEKIIESVPNISEGRDRAIVEECVEQVRSTPGCLLLNYSSDPDHNRSVITYIGSPEGCEEAGVKLAKKAAELIDLTKHRGEHPRMGCVDVMPFIPVRGAAMEDCVELSKRVGRRIAEEAGLPVFLYEKSATAPHRENLAEVRRGQFEGLDEKLKSPDWIPDFGGPEKHPTGGAVCVGARAFLIAYNINLGTDNVEIAKKISRVIRESRGGLKCVKAMGVMLKEKNTAQVSMNMTDFRVTPLYRVNELVKAEAARYGVPVIGTELIGLTPAEALFDAAEYYLQIEDFDWRKQVIESRLPEKEGNK